MDASILNTSIRKLSEKSANQKISYHMQILHAINPEVAIDDTPLFLGEHRRGSDGVENSLNLLSGEFLEVLVTRDLRAWRDLRLDGPVESRSVDDPAGEPKALNHHFQISFVVEEPGVDNGRGEGVSSRNVHRAPGEGMLQSNQKRHVGLPGLGGLASRRHEAWDESKS